MSVASHTVGQTIRGRIVLSEHLTVQTVPGWYKKTPRFCTANFIVDLSSVKEIDSAGLSLLVHWSNLARASSVQLKFTDVPPQLHKLAEIFKLEAIFAE